MTSYKSKFSETHQTSMMTLASEFGKSPSIEKIFELFFTSNSLVAQYKAKDGRTYQVEITEMDQTPKREI
jgi:hypothetical protein